jgi:hypothetical protein
MYCAGNPVVLVDPNGMEIGWVEGTGTGIYWDPKINSRSEAATAGVKYHGQEGWGYNESTGSKIHYKSDGTQSESTTQLEGTTVYGLKGTGAAVAAIKSRV